MRAAGSILANSWLRASGESSHLLSFVFHGLFLNDSEVRSSQVDPQQGITVEMFKTLVRHFLELNYRFVTPADLLSGLDSQGRYVLLTFDDGYYNNVRALPVLEEFSVPAVFFIATANVNCRKAYWWDVVYRDMAAKGKNIEEIRRVQAKLKALKTTQVEDYLMTRFGTQALRPISDIDRPFTALELKDFAAHRLVFLGNHTRDHAILPNYSVQEIASQIQGGQDDIRSITGRLPQIIAYPNGDCSMQVAQVAQAIGLQIGVLARSGRNLLPLDGGSDVMMRLKRNIVWGGRNIDAQCRIVRSGLPIHRTLRAFSSSSSLAFSRREVA